MLATLLAGAALIVATVAFSRQSSGPTYSSAERAAAQAHLCSRYRLAAQAVHLETTGPDPDMALARIANTNSSAMLEAAAANPALDTSFRDAALALADSYQTVTATGVLGQSDPQFSAAIEDSNAKYQVLRELCGD